MRMNASQAEAAYGTPRMTVGRWINGGKLPADADGYFEERAFKVLNAKRLTLTAPGRTATDINGSAPVKKAAPKKRAPAKKKAAPAPKKRAAVKEKATAEEQPKPPQSKQKNPPTSTGGINGPDQHESFNPLMAGSRQEVDLRKALANARKAEMEVKIKMKDLISRELVSRIFRKLYTIDSTEWRGLGPRLAPDVMAVCKVEDPAVEVEISDRIEREVFRTLGHVKRVMNEFLEEIESEDRVDDGY